MVVKPTDDTGDYAGACGECETCEQGRVRPGHTCCSACELAQARADALHDALQDDIEQDNEPGTMERKPV